MWENRRCGSFAFVPKETLMKKTTKSIIAAALCASMMLAGCSNNNIEQTTTASQTAAVQNTDHPEAPTSFKLTESTDAGNSGDVKLEKGDTYAVISIRDFGDIKIKLYPDLVPYGVYNFIELAKNGTYNGRNIHRIEEDFMLQGGSASGDGSGGSSFEGGEFKNEVNTSLRHYYGALCYASNSLGDLSDGFYIVNSKKPKTNLENTYSLLAQNFMNQAQQYGSIAQSITEDVDNYEYMRYLYGSLFEYSRDAYYSIVGMYNSITDAVKKTYEEKGGKPELDGCYTVFGQTVEGFEVIDKITAVEKEANAQGVVSKPVKDIIIDKIEIFTME